MNNDRKEKLTALGADVLADALLELALRFDAVDDRVNNMIASPDENIESFKKRLSAIKKSKTFIKWGEGAAFADELAGMLEDLKAGVRDPLTGVKLLAKFYEADGKTLGRCDDSSGYIGDLFRESAKDIFIEYASRCTDKKMVADIVLKLNLKDNYGVRDALIHSAGKYLTEQIMREMVNSLHEMIEERGKELDSSNYYLLIESLARQLKDPELFEVTKLSHWGKFSPQALIDIARVYFESGEAETALSRLDGIPEKEKKARYLAPNLDSLLSDIYRALNNKEKLSEILHHTFKVTHSLSSLQELLDIVGSDKKDDIINSEIVTIFEEDYFNAFHASFMLSVDKIIEAEQYIFKHAENINGSFYNSLLPLAEKLESHKHYLAACLIYRRLLISILDQANSTIYKHGVNYLCKLDSLASSVKDWKTFIDHSEFMEFLSDKHKRKSSFWSKYEEKKG